MPPQNAPPDHQNRTSSRTGIVLGISLTLFPLAGCAARVSTQSHEHKTPDAELGLPPAVPAAPTPPGRRWTRQSPPAAPPCRAPYDEALPADASIRLGTSAVYQGAFVRAAFLPDSKQAATGSFYGHVHLWDVSTGRVVARMTGRDPEDERQQGMRGLGSSHDGKRLIAMSADGLLFYDVATRRMNAFRDLAVGRGLYLNDMALATNAGVGVVGRCTRESGRPIVVFSTETGTPLLEIEAHEEEFDQRCSNAVAISDDGQLIASGGHPNKVVLFNRQGQELGSSSVGGVAVKALSFSPDGSRLMVATTNSAINVFDTQTLRAVRSFGWSPTSITDTGASFSVDGKLILSSRTDVLLWHYETQEVLARYGGLPGHGAAAVWSRDGRWIAYPATTPDTLVLINVETQQRHGPYDMCRHDNEITSAAWSADGRLLATGSVDGTARIWDAKSGEALQLLHINTSNGAYSNQIEVGFYDNGKRLVVSGTDCRLRAFDTATGELVREFPWRPLAPDVGERTCGMTYGLQVSPARDRVAATHEDGTLRTYALPSGEPIHAQLVSVSPDSTDLGAPMWSPDGRIIAVPEREGTQLWAGPKRVGFLKEKQTIAAAFSPNGKTIATATMQGQVTLWKADGTRIRSFHRESTHRPRDILFTPDGKSLVTGGETGVVFSLSGTRESVLTGQQGVVALAFSPDGRHLITGAQDRTALVWKETAWR